MKISTGIKIKKGFLKTIFFFPFYLLVILLYNFIFYDFEFGYNLAVTAIILSIITVFINVFDYDKFNGIASEDYLESKHKTRVQCSDDLWYLCKQLDSHLPNLKMEAIQYNRELIQYKIHFNILIGQLNSILEFKKVHGHITIRIEKQFINVLPDRGVNLKIIRRVENKLKLYTDIESNEI